MDGDFGETRESEQSPDEPTLVPSDEPEVQLAGPIRCGLTCLIQADQVEVSNGAALVVVGDDVSIDKGVSLVTVGRTVSLQKGGSQWLIAGDARVEQGCAGVVVARRVEATDARVGLLLAGSVQGNVHAVFDTDAAIRFGAALGTTLGVALLVRRILFGR